MPLYDWRCTCGKETVVKRSMAEYDVPPDEKCTCENPQWTRFIKDYGGFELKGDGWFRDTVTATGKPTGR